MIGKKKSLLAESRLCVEGEPSGTVDRTRDWGCLQMMVVSRRSGVRIIFRMHCRLTPFVILLLTYIYLWMELRWLLLQFEVCALIFFPRFTPSSRTEPLMGFYADSNYKKFFKLIFFNLDLSSISIRTNDLRMITHTGKKFLRQCCCRTES